MDNRTILDVERIIPLPEAEDYTVRLKEKQDETRQVAQATHNFDFTKYDLTLRGVVQRELGKRHLIWAVVDFAVREGLTIAKLKTLLGSARLFGVPGNVGQSEFLERVGESPMQTYTFDRKRYFTDDAHLLHVNGDTYALSNQWGIQSLPFLNDVISELPPDAVAYTESVGG